MQACGACSWRDSFTKGLEGKNYTKTNGEIQVRMKNSHAFLNFGLGAEKPSSRRDSGWKRSQKLQIEGNHVQIKMKGNSGAGISIKTKALVLIPTLSPLVLFFFFF